MKIVDVIQKKVNGNTFTEEDIEFVVKSIYDGSMPDYQTAAWLMAIYINGLSKDGAYYLTKSMWTHSAHIDLRGLRKDIIDKHSTGGIGDKVSLILLPIVACLGLPVAKISGRGLGFTGGTIDKLESVGVDVNLNEQRMLKYLKENNIFVSSQTDDLAPVDKILYHLRDVTGTVGDYGLIASSILSKKFAILGTHVFLDVKYGTGAFCPTYSDALKLIKYLKYVAKKMHRKLTIIVSSMDQPLGRAVGNAIEVKEAMDFLENKEVSSDLKQLIYKLASVILMTYHKNWDEKKTYSEIEKTITSGKALAKFYEWLEAQGGNIKMLQKKTFFNPNSKFVVKAPCDGYLTFASTSAVGMMSTKLGAGRILKTDKIDMQAGLWWHKKWGDKVKKGEPVVTCYSSWNIDPSDMKKEFNLCCKIVRHRPKRLSVVRKVIYDN